MNNGEWTYYRSWYAKEWDPIYFTNRHFTDYEPYVERTKRSDTEGNNFGIFLQDYEDSVPSCKVDEVEEFCEDASVDDIKSDNSTADQLRLAWFDQRIIPRLGEKNDCCVKKCQNPLSARRLYQLLREPVWNSIDISWKKSELTKSTLAIWRGRVTRRRQKIDVRFFCLICNTFTKYPAAISQTWIPTTFLLLLRQHHSTKFQS